MTDLPDKAVAQAQTLAPEVQDEIARLMLAFVGEDAPLDRFTPEEAAELDASEAAAAGGDLATESEVRAIWDRHGL